MDARRGLFLSLVVAVCFYGNRAQKTVCTQEAVADIVFLVDGSWSIGSPNFEQVRQFLFTLVNSFDVGPDQVRIGLVQFSTTPRTEFLLNTYQNKEDILRTISTLPYKGGGTKTGLGLDFMLTQHFVKSSGSRADENVPQIAVVITDGQSQDNVGQHAQDLRSRGIIVYAIGIKEADEDELREIASDPKDQHVYSVSDFAALQEISQSIVQTLCTTVEEAKRQLSLVVKECVEATVADIVFLVDGSSSIGVENFQEVRSFLRSFIESLDVGPDKVRVGLAQYSNNAHQEFLLKDHMDKRSLLEQVDNLPYRTGGTETGKGIAFLQANYFTREAGSRADQRVPQIAVVLTDGDSADNVTGPAMQLRRQGVIVFAIGVGAANRVELQAIANRPHERFLVLIDSYQALQRLSHGMLKTVCVSMEDQRQALVQRFADIFFLVDSGMATADFGQVRNLLVRLTNQLNFSSSTHRLGLAQFGQDVKVEFLLNAFKTKEETLAGVRRLRQRRVQPNEPRNLGAALAQVSSFFTAKAGSREDQGYQQFLVVATGGESKDDVYRASRLLKTAGVTVLGIDLAPLTPRGARGEEDRYTEQMNILATSQHIYQSASIAPSLKAIFEREQEVTAVGADCRTAKVADIVFIVDESGSIGNRNFQLVRGFLHKMVEGMDVSPKRVRVGIVLYSDTATAQVYLNSFNDKSEILQFIKILPYRGGGTSTGAALKFANEQVFTMEKGSRRNQGVQQVAVVITDGESQDTVASHAADLRRSGVTVYAIGVQNADINELVQIATYPPNKYVFNVDSFAKLKTLEQSLQKMVCTNIIDKAVTEDKRTDKVKEGCVEKDEADIFFLIDHSGSIYPKDFTDMKKFIAEFLQTFRIGPKNVRMGVVKYADSPQLEFDLTRYSDANSTEEAVLNIRQIGGGTNTGAALTFMGPYFERAKTTRDDKVPEYLIIITDGVSADSVKEPAEKLRDQGVIVYAIGVKSASEAQLLEIGGSPDKTFFVNDFDALTLIKNKIATEICAPDVCNEVPGDLLFLIDSSGIIDPSDYQKMKVFTKSVVDRFEISESGVRVGLMQFGTTQNMEFPLNRFYGKAEMHRAIEDMQQLSGLTYTGRAIGEIMQYFDPSRGGRPNLKQSLVLITDDEARDEVKGPADALRAKGVHVHTIGLVNADTTQLLQISGTQDNVYNARDFDGLRDFVSPLALQLCESEADCKKIEVADIVFLVDGSTSITLPKFRSMLKFMQSVVNGTTVGERLTRFGVILYSNDPKSMFTLNQYYTRKEVRNAIAALKSPYGDTYTGKALDFSLQYFNVSGRPTVPKILMVITDGDATDRHNLAKPSEALRDHGIQVISIGVEGADKAQLEVMAGHDKSKVFYVDNFDALETLYKDIQHVLCNSTKPACEKQQADLVLLVDQSGSIDQGDYSAMKEFMKKLVSSFKISPDLVRVGVAQFSTDPQKEFYLNEFQTETEINKHIDSFVQRGGGTKIGKALEFIQDYFQASTGSRIAQKISQNLVLITDGESEDEVEAAAANLRFLGVEVFAIGIGNVHDLELLQITGTPKRLFTVQNFGSLENIKQKVVDTICESTIDPHIQEGGCLVNIAMGFDITRRTGSPLLLGGHPKLQSFLPEIIHYVSTLQGLCCLEGKTVTSKIGFRVVESSGKVRDDMTFEPYSDAVVRKVLDLKMSEPTHFNAALLESFGEKFSTRQFTSGAKVLVIFSDGLDDDVVRLQQTSERLRESGINALLIVALDGVQRPEQLQAVEFGRGFGYDLPLSIAMHSVGSAMLKEVDAVVDSECCNVTCKCSGHEGVRGGRGPPGTKGLPGPKGHPGFPGEEGVAGDRGLPGPSGPQGIQGCPGTRGQKGFRGHRGNRGDDGDQGLDGVNGEQGLTGASGGSGGKGDPGSPGITGITGELGLKGQRGLRGDPGEAGVDNTVQGPKGDGGNPGVPGEAGEDGVIGESGITGNSGNPGRRGPPGLKGPAGEEGGTGLGGSPGPSGSQGQSGVRGQPGARGAIGLPGPQGGSGPVGNQGLPGRRGGNGHKGQPGEPGGQGTTGPMGPRGLQGQDGRDGYGPAGSQGPKGELGFPGYSGVPGESGLQGTKGWVGPKGNLGRGGNTGSPGEQGVPGDTGYLGHKGPRGPLGTRSMSECQLITYIRDNCACSQGRTECPAYPTELVFALDMSEDVTKESFEKTRSALLSLLDGISIAESNCPTGARVAVVAYSAYTKYLIRFQDYRRKTQLVEAIQNIALERTANKRHLGASMRYVGQNVFKRTRQAVRMRKVAVFFANGDTQDLSAVVTAVMEFRGLNVVPAVVALGNSPAIRRALESDDTGNSIFTTLGRSQDLTADLGTVRNCAICYDPCRPAQQCSVIQEVPAPQSVDVDLAVVVDGSREIQGDQYTGVQELLASVVEQLALSPKPNRVDSQARVALVQQSGSLHGPGQQAAQAAKLEFGLQTYRDRAEMQTYLAHNLRQQGGSSALGQTLEFTLEEVLLKAPSARKRKALLAIVGAGTAAWDSATLHRVSQRAKCQGVALFVVTVGDNYNRTQVEELASAPMEQHLIHLGRRARDEERGYCQRFFRVFLSTLNRAVNNYPPASLKRTCDQLQAGQGQGQGQGQAQGQGHVTVDLGGQVSGYVDLEELAEEAAETFLEQTGVLETKTAQSQVDVVAALSMGDGEHKLHNATTPPKKQETKVGTNKAACTLKQDVGKCSDYVPRWHFDTQQNECSRFWYGGCGGNSNRFETQEACEALCLRRRQ